MKDNHPTLDVTSLHKSSLRRPRYMVSHRVQPYRGDFSENFKANIKKAYRLILLDPFCLHYLAKIHTKQLKISGMERTEQLQQVHLKYFTERLIELRWEAIRTGGFVVLHLENSFSYFML
jgi:hypothetical protein